MSAEDSLLPVVLPADAGAARPFRRAAGFFLVAIGLPLIAYLLSAISGDRLSGNAAFGIAILAIALVIIAGIHVLAGLMIWLGSPHHREAGAAQ